MIAPSKRTVPRVKRPPTRKSPRLSVPGGGIAFARVEPAVDLADDLDPFLHRSGERHAVGEHVVLAVAVRRLPQNAEAGVADDPDRLHRLPDQHRSIEVGRVEPEPALVARIRQPRREAHADGRPTWLLRSDADLRGDDDVFDVAACGRR